MKRTNTGVPLASRAAWIGLVLLLGLLLSTCEPAGVNQPDGAAGGRAETGADSGADQTEAGTDVGEEGEDQTEAASEAAAVLTFLPEKCFLVDNDGRIRRFDSTIPGCDITAFAIPMDKGGIGIIAIHNEAFRGKRLTKLTIPNSVTEIGSHAFADNPIVTVILDPNANLTFDDTSFPNNLWDAYDGANKGEAGTWTWDEDTQMWSFEAKLKQ